MTKKNIVLKGIKIAIKIAFIMFLISFGIGVINELVFKGNFRFISIFDYFLGMLGYGSIYTESIIIHMLISLTGIIMVAFLTAYLTMNLFMREKIFIYNKLVLWRIGSDYFASFLIVNTEDEIDEVEVSFATFINKKVLCISKTEENFSIPYMPKKGHWKIDIPIKQNSYIHESLNKINKEGWTLYLSIKYTDIFTGQKFTNVYKYSEKDVVGSKVKAGILYKQEMHKNIKSNVIVEDDSEQKEYILKHIQSNAFYIDNQFGTAIGYGTKIDKRVTEDNKESIIVSVDWEKNETDDFGMLCYKFTSNLDLRKIYRNNGRVEFDLRTNLNIKSVTFELKAPGLVKIIDKSVISYSNEFVLHSIQLSEHHDVENFSKIDEMCFLVREHQVIDKSELAEFEIADLKIVYDKNDE